MFHRNTNKLSTAEKKKEAKHSFLKIPTAVQQNHLLPFLDVKSLANAESIKLFSKSLSLETRWKKLVLSEITTKPRLSEYEKNENFKTFYKRANQLLIRIQQALNNPAVTPIEFHNLFKEVVENGYDKYAPLLIDFVNVNKQLNTDDEPLFNNTFLQIAAHIGNAELIKIILHKGITNIDAAGAGHHVLMGSKTGGFWMDGTGDSALIKAASSGDLESVALLIRRGSKVNFRSRSTNNTALHQAADKGHVECVKFLLHKNADVNISRNKFGTKELAYEVADINGHKECAELIGMRMQELGLAIPKSFCLIQ